MQSPELQNQISQWRQKATLGTLTVEEMKEAIKLLRAGRVSATATAKVKKSPAKSADDLLKELEGM